MTDINQPNFVEVLEDGTVDMTKLAFIRGEEYVNTMWDPFYVQSIGKCKKTGKVLAASDTRFYMSEAYDCIYLR